MLNYVLTYLSIGTMVLTAMVTLLLRNKFYDTGSNYFKIYFVIAAITDVTLGILQYNGMNNLQVANVFGVTQFFLLSMGLLSWYRNNELRRLMFLILALTALVLAIYVLGNLHKNTLDTYSMTIGNLMLVVLSALVLLQLTGDRTQFLIKNYRFWFAVSVFLYFTVSSVLLSTADILIDEHFYLRRYTWVLNSILSIVANSLFIKGILCLPLKRT